MTNFMRIYLLFALVGAAMLYSSLGFYAFGNKELSLHLGFAGLVLTAWTVACGWLFGGDR